MSRPFDCRLQFTDFDKSTLPALLYVGVVTLTPLPLTLNLSNLHVCKVSCRPEPDVLIHSYRLIYSARLLYNYLHVNIRRPHHFTIIDIISLFCM